MTLLPPEAQQVARELDALNQALRALRDYSLKAAAQAAVLEVLRDRPASESVTDYVERAAMSFIAGVPTQEPVIEAPIPLEQHTAEVLGLAWLALMQGDFQKALALQDKCFPITLHANMSLHALMLWSSALKTLRDNPLESQRLWTRATEVGRIYALEPTSMMRWTMAASFLA